VSGKRKKITEDVEKVGLDGESQLGDLPVMQVCGDVDQAYHD
jgi:hypothetical protein